MGVLGPPFSISVTVPEKEWGVFGPPFSISLNAKKSACLTAVWSSSMTESVPRKVTINNRLNQVIYPCVINMRTIV